MSDQATMAAQPFPPGMSRLERLPDELKLRVGYYLMAPVAAEAASEPTAQAESDGYDWSDAPHRRQTATDDLDGNEALDQHPKDFNDSMLALASTSNRLCDIFLVEHSKKYGLQNTLYRSIELGKINLVQRVVEYGADVNKTDTELPYKVTPLQLAVKSEQLPIILYLLRRGVDKVDELVMEVLRDRVYHQQINEEHADLAWTMSDLQNYCLCDLLHVLMDATLGNSQTDPTKPRLSCEVREALVPNGRHLWFILRTCIRQEWGCDCDNSGDLQCPMRLISLLRRYGAKWMPCGAQENVPRVYTSWNSLYASAPEMRFPGGSLYFISGRGAADLARVMTRLGGLYMWNHDDDPVLVKPSVASAMDDALLANTTYKHDHCLPFLTAILEHGVAAEEGDLTHAMNLSCDPANKELSIDIVRVLLQGGTNPNDPGVMKTAMRLACMEATKDAAVAFVTLLLEHGADPSAEELQDEIQGAAEKWWIQSGWQSSDIFCRILRLLVDGGLDERVAWEIFAVLGLGHDLVAEGGGGATKV
ncbi:hypothetical protein SLS64_011438 [Diaporthe eres]